MRLIQFLRDDGSRAVAAWTEEGGKYRVVTAASTRLLALDAHRNQRTLTEEVIARLTDETVNITELAAANRLLVPLDHEDPAHMVLAITGLTHLGSAATRDAMHMKLQDADLSDSMKMFKLGVEGGKPAAGQAGVQPEWAYKGDGDWLVQPGGTISRPGYAEGGGEEAEVAGLYVIAEDGTVLRLGFALGNEYSDHIMERRNYLYLAHSKLRPSSFGPELLVGDLPNDVRGTVTITRGDAPIWSSEFLTGEANMTHSVANLEEHHFKYAGFRRPGDVHVYYFGAGVLSFGDGVAITAGDRCTVMSPQFGAALVLDFSEAPPTRTTVRAL
jgi:hypothetical protein